MRPDRGRPRPSTADGARPPARRSRSCHDSSSRSGRSSVRQVSRAATGGRGRTRPGVDNWADRARRDRCRQRDGDARRDDRQGRAAPHRGRLRRQCELVAVGSHRLAPSSRVADPARRRSRRALRAPQGVPDRHDLVRRSITVVRCGAQCRRAHRPSAAGIGAALRTLGSLAILQASFRGRATAPRSSARGRDSGGVRGAIGPFLGGWGLQGVGCAAGAQVLSRVRFSSTRSKTAASVSSSSLDSRSKK